MDIVWIVALTAFWLVMCEFVFGLSKLESPKGGRS